ncbi:AraC-type DNA-binding protein [Sphingomonas palmae]|uniref:AraC-type DNA-binding protein n=1 Tax=Sphingomonas palmae TaxID=1855283 RepID=A0A1H7M729_9SPHN|nr:AraC-type DNA-binding protein [Sphingomonas palmae]
MGGDTLSDCLRRRSANMVNLDWRLATPKPTGNDDAFFSWTKRMLLPSDMVCYFNPKQRNEMVRRRVMVFTPFDDHPGVTISRSDGSSPEGDGHLAVALPPTEAEDHWLRLPAGSWHLAPELRLILKDALTRADLDGVSGLYVQAKFLELTCRVSEMLNAGELTPLCGSAKLDEFDTRRIVRARDLIHEHFGESLTLARIAKECGLNRSLLSRGFRLMYDTSVLRYVAETRLGAATRLLLTSNAGVASIGHQCGYSNNAAFTRAFNRRYGMSPSTMRRQAPVGASHRSAPTRPLLVSSRVCSRG